MLRYITTAAVIGMLAYSGNAYAWVQSDGVTVSNIIEWQDDAPVYFTLSNGTVCYVPNTEKNLYSLVLSIYASGKSANIHCHDSVETYGGVEGHRLHRIIAN